MNNIIEFVTENKLGKHRISGDQIELGCPNKECPNHNQPQFYINRFTGAFYCHRCGWKGANIKQLAFKLGLIILQEPVKSTHIYVSPKDVDNMQRCLLGDKPALSFLKDERGLLDKSILQFRLGLKVVNNNPAIVIPYFDKTDTCVGLKYYFYTRPSGISKMIFEKGSKGQLFNLNNVVLTQQLIITEGEFDAITAWQYGYENVGSMPHGASGINGWVEEIEMAPSFILCLDNDDAGHEGATRLGTRLGLSKCFRAYPKLKDLNEYAQCGLDHTEVDKVFKNTEPMFNAPVTEISQYLDLAKTSLSNPIVAKGTPTGWKSIDYYLGGIRPGEVTVTSGITNHGKTTFAMALIANLIKQDTKCLIVSPEMREQALLVRMANNHYRHQVNIEELDEFMQQYKDKVYIAKVFDTWTDRKKSSLLNHLFDTIEYSVKRNGVQFVLLDHLRLFLNPKDQDGERFAIDEFMQKCVHSAIMNQIHIWLAVQPKNLPANQKRVTISDLKGSSNIAQDAHNVILIHRHINEKKETNIVEIEIGKNRELGSCGIIPLEFDVASNANYYEGK